MKVGAAAAVLCAAAALAGEEPLPRCDVAPGWNQSGPRRSYTADNLYDYMDGNSEGYLIYGFQRMGGVTCQAGEVSFVVDLSEMADVESAWGLFASNRDPRVRTEVIGMAGQVVPQRGIFVKGNRFIEITASPASTDHAADIRTFLKGLDERMDGATTMPAQVGWFPAERLEAASIRLVPQSVLGLSVLKRGYVATYDFGRAFLVRQPSEESASQVMDGLRQRFGDIQPSDVAGDAFQAVDKYLGRLLVFRKGVYIGGFANLTDAAAGAKAAQAFASNLP